MIHTKAGKNTLLAPIYGKAFPFWPFRGKKSMEMWQLILIILAVILLLFMMAWYASLNTDLGDLFSKLGDLI